MPTTTPITIAAGFQSVFVGKRDSSGYLVGGLSTVAAAATADMYRLYGALRLPLQQAAPQRVPVLGDDGTMGTFTFDPTTLPEGELELSAEDIDFEAFAQGTLVWQNGATGADLGVLGPNTLDLQQIILLAHQQNKSYPAGGKKWRTYIVPNCTIAPSGSELAHQAAASFKYGISMDKTSVLPWGTAVANGTQGTTRLVNIPVNADNPVMLAAALGNNTEDEFILDFTPAGATAAYVKVWVNGTLKTITTDFTVNVSTKTITFVAPPATDAKIVIWYEFLATELV